MPILAMSLQCGRRRNWQRVRTEHDVHNRRFPCAAHRNARYERCIIYGPRRHGSAPANARFASRASMVDNPLATIFPPATDADGNLLLSAEEALGLLRECFAEFKL